MKMTGDLWPTPHSCMTKPLAGYVRCRVSYLYVGTAHQQGIDVVQLWELAHKCSKRLEAEIEALVRPLHSAALAGVTGEVTIRLRCRETYMLKCASFWTIPINRRDMMTPLAIATVRAA